MIKNKKLLISLIGGVCILGLGITFFIPKSNQTPPTITLKEASKTEKMEDIEEVEDNPNLIKYNNTHDQGLDTLEKPKSKVSEKDFTIAKKKVLSALEYLNTSKDNTPSFGGFYGITTPQMVELMKAVYANHFLPEEESFQLFESNHENVQQFILDLTNIEANRTVTATGNINTDTNQVQFSTVQGDYGFASYGDGIQSPNDIPERQE